MSMKKYVNRYILLAICSMLLWGCSSANPDAPVLDSTGRHPANWIVDHRAAYVTSSGTLSVAAVVPRNNCSECHGADLTGGMVKVSCFSRGIDGMTCHAHPAGFAAYSSHGRNAKKEPGLSSGLAHCRNCHGTGFTGGTFSSVACLNAACHGSANSPHPRLWDGTQTSQAQQKKIYHFNVGTGNAPACAPCHLAGQNLASLPAPPAQPAGTAPGCFNNTLCHGVMGHPAGWRDPAQHGAEAKAQPGLSTGFAYCQTCHGADFRGGISGQSCMAGSSATGACHVRNNVAVNSPHSPAPWRGGLRSHTDTEHSNAENPAVCAQCHANGANSSRQPSPPAPGGSAPGCFNNTLCHGTVGHPTGWADPAQHGATAKANLTYCQDCHAQKVNGANAGPGSNPRFTVVLGRLAAGCETCHKANTAHPPVVQIPAQFGITGNLNTPWYKHRLAGNFTTACVLCHGANFEGGVGPTCTNCHRSGLPTQVANCASCHGKPPTGSAYPNRAFAHTKHNALSGVVGVCDVCHSGVGSGTLQHFLNAKAQPTVVPATIAFPASYPYNAKGLTASAAVTANGVVCSNISCHGGQQTPPWRTGVLNVNTQCANCHVFGTTQFNSYNSGPFNHHTQLLGSSSSACLNCHDVAKLAQSHFANLATTQMEGPASATIGGGATSVNSYNPSTRSCSPTCHGTEVWR